MKLLVAFIYAHIPLLPVAIKTTWSGLLVLGDISTFFSNLYTQLTLFALGMAVFFFAWAALLYMTAGGNERSKTHALSALYAALGGLVLALLAQTIGGIVDTAASGQ